MARGQRQIGARIVLGGEADFRRQVQSCNTSLRTMRSEMNMVTQQFAGQANSVEALEARHNTLERTLSESTRLQETLEEALANARRNYEEAGSSLESYESQLASARTALAELERQQSETSDESITQQIEEQREQMQELEGVVQRAERAYSQSGDAVQNWQRQLNDARTQSMRFTAELEDVSQYLEEARQSADHTASSIDEMGRRVRETSNDVETSTSDTAEAVEDLTSATAEFFTIDTITEYADAVAEKFQALAEVAWEAAQQIDEAYDLIASKTGATGQDLEQYKDIINGIYADIPAEMTEIADAVGAVSQRFSAPNTEIERFSKQMVMFSKITEEDVNDTLKGTSRLLTAFGEGMQGADILLDTLLASAQDKGVQIDEVLENTLTNANAFKKLNLSSSGAVRFMGELMEAGIEAEGAVSSLETAYDNCMENGKNFRDELLRVNDALTDGTVSTQDMADAQALFGDAFSKIADAIASGNIDFRYLIENMDNLTGIQGRVQSTFDATKDGTDDISVAVSNLKTALGKLTKEGLSAVAPLVSGFADVLSDVNEALEDTPDFVKKTVGVVGLLATGCGILAPKILAVKLALDGLRTANNIQNGINGIRAAMSGATAEATAAATATSATGTSLMTVARAAGPYAAVIAGAVAVLKGLQASSDAYVEDMKESDAQLRSLLESSDAYAKRLTDVRDKMAETLDKSSFVDASAQAQVAQPIVESLERLQNQSSLTKGELGLMEEQVARLNDVYPELDMSIDTATGKLKSKGQAIDDLSSYMDTYMKKIEETARKETLLSLKKEQVQAEIDFEVSKTQMSDIKQKMEAELKKAGVESFEAFENMNPFEKVWLNMNPTDGIIDTGLLYELKEQYDELNEKQHELNDVYIESEAKVKALEEAMKSTESATAKSTDENAKNAESWTGAGAQIDAYAQKYVDLSVKMQGFTGDIEAFRASFTDEEEALRSLFDATVASWQTSYDTVMSGLGNEVIALTDNMGAWQAYRDEVENSINSVSSLFTVREQDENKSWENMHNGLVSNANAYDLWNANVNAVLESARYQTDEAFREIANRIMLSGIESADYLDSFVQHVDLTTTQAKGDIYEFTDLSTETEQYASQMANLKSATEESMSGIAGVFDATKSAAQQSLEELSASLTEKSEEYTSYSENAKNLVESERYKTDEGFRTMVNTMLQQGMAGAGVLAELWTAMQAGNSEVDTLLASFGNFESAMGSFADVTASTELALQNGMGSMVSIVDSAGESLKIAIMNDEILMASGLTGEHMTGAVDSMVEKSIAKLQSDTTTQEFYDAGRANREAYDMGFNGGSLRTQGAQGMYSLSKDRAGVTNNMNLTVNQNQGNWFSDITNWIRKQLS